MQIEIVSIVSNDGRNHTVHYAKVDHTYDIENENPYADSEPVCGAKSQYGFNPCDLNWMRTIGTPYSICKRCNKILK